MHLAGIEDHEAPRRDHLPGVRHLQAEGALLDDANGIFVVAVTVEGVLRVNSTIARHPGQVG
jgi:hypothetical protein